MKVKIKGEISMKILKIILKISSCILLIITIITVFNTCFTKSKQIKDVDSDVNIELDMDGINCVLK